MNDQILTFEQLTGYLYIIHCNIELNLFRRNIYFLLCGFKDTVVGKLGVHGITKYYGINRIYGVHEKQEHRVHEAKKNI